MKMTGLLCIAISCIMSACLAACGTTATSGVGVETFDAASWRLVGAPVWRSGTYGLEAGPGDQAGYLVSTALLDDYRLSVEFWVEDKTNSGIFIRCGEIAELADVNPVNCYEINIWDNHPNQDFRTGSIVGRVTPERHVDSLGRWNTLQIDVRGNSITVVLNGERTATVDNVGQLTGAVALQYAGEGLVRFRNLVIEPY